MSSPPPPAAHAVFLPPRLAGIHVSSRSANSEPSDELPPDEVTPGEDPQLTGLTGLFVLKPESADAIKGQDVTFSAKVDSSTLMRKPTMKWLKGKWLDLGSKAGKHLQFKETYDRNTKIYTYEMRIVKVADGDAGGYRCEVTSKDKCDSCTFEVSVQAVEEQQQDNILEAFKRSGDAGEDAGDLDFSALLKKREKKQPQAPQEEVDVWDILKAAKPCDYEKIAFEYGITDLRGMLKRLKKMKTVEPKKSDAFLKKPEPAYSVDKGRRIQLSVEVADPDAPVKWLKNGHEIKPSAKYVFESVGNRRTLTINKCNLSDDAAYECVVGEDKCFTEVFVKEPPVTITKLLDDVHTVVGEKVEFEVEVSEEGAHVKWMKDGEELTKESAASKYRFKKDGKKHILIINDAAKEDIGTYFALTNGGESKAELEVEDKELQVLQSIADLTVKASEQAVFKCEVSDEKVTGKWFKDGVEVQPGERIKMTHIGRTHKLTISDVKPSDVGDYTFVPDGYALSLSAKLNFLEIKIDYVPRQDPPKIHLDTSGTGSNNTITVVAGNKLRFDVEISGDPPPVVCWMKGNKTVSEAEGRVRVETRKTLSSFVIQGAEKEDEGFYSLTVTNPAGEDKAELFVKVVDVPDPPENVKCTSVGENCATITWDPPAFDGGVPVKGYLMERKKIGSSRWTKLNFDVYEATTYEAKKMIEGVLYEMRVFAVNGIGISQPSVNSKPFMPIAPTSEPIRLLVEDVTDSTCALRWLPPEKVGPGGIDGYIIEYCKEGSKLDGRWAYLTLNAFVGKHFFERKCSSKDNNVSEQLIQGCQTHFCCGPHRSYGFTPRAVMSANTYTVIVQLPHVITYTHTKKINTYLKPEASKKLLIQFILKWGLVTKMFAIKKREDDLQCCYFSDNVLLRFEKKLNELMSCQSSSGDEWVPANKKPVEKNQYRVKDLPVGEKMLFRVVAINIAGRSPPATLCQGVTIREIMEHPKIRLPRQLRTRLIKVVGEKVNLVIPFQGKPRPVAAWYKDGVPLEDRSVGTRTSEVDTILFIRSAERVHSGTYTLAVQIENMEDRADIRIQVVGLVHRVRAQPAAQLHRVRPGHGQRVLLPSLQRERLRPEREAWHQHQHGARLQDGFGIQASALQREGPERVPQVHSAPGGPECGGGLHHGHQLCRPRLPEAEDHLDEEQDDHWRGPQVPDAEQPGRADAEHPQTQPVRRRTLLLQGHQRAWRGRGGVQAGGSSGQGESRGGKEMRTDLNG
ncbi:myosin binding protein Ca isoform X2 [Phyllopteryx taeniolatus]|uniref:myosin binding protein Ca isoform X2 n=1 Tax=Phyllopteryx taeniolatus TaxID=161469 RepID=UPI002AD4E2C7|nr:myosin binding protein Ca isoform X2 [Phyllopteryx taeniolatus]